MIIHQRDSSNEVFCYFVADGISYRRKKRNFFYLSKAAEGFSKRRAEVCVKKREKSRAGRKLREKRTMEKSGNGPAHVTSAEKRQDGEERAADE